MKQKHKEEPMEFMLCVVVPIVAVIASYASKKMEERKQKENYDDIVRKLAGDVIKYVQLQLPPKSDC